MTRHELKLWTDQFFAMKTGAKRADVRRCDDRRFRRGDECLYRDFQAKAGKYSGDALLTRITHLTRAAGQFDLVGIYDEEGQLGDRVIVPIVVLSIELLEIGTYDKLKTTAPLAVTPPGESQSVAAPTIQCVRRAGCNSPRACTMAGGTECLKAKEDAFLRQPGVAAAALRAIDPTTPDRYVLEPCGHRSQGSVYFCDRERNHPGEHFHGGRIAGPRQITGGTP